VPIRLGEFEQLVLLALIHLGNDAYGVTVRREITRRTGRATSFGTVYATLARLEEKGLISSRLGDATPQRGGRRKKYFRILAPGRLALSASIKVLRTMTKGLSPSWDSL